MTATDIALVIAAIGTTAGTIGGLILPIWQSQSKTKNEKNAEVHAIFQARVDELLVETDSRSENVQEQLTSIAIAKSFQNKGQTIPDEYLKLSKDGMNLAKLRMAAAGSAYGIQTEVLIEKCFELTAVYSPYWNAIEESDESKRHSILLDCSKLGIEIENSIGVAVSDLFSEVSKKYPM